ncbi:class I SAM-dependent methyltransferase [Saccharibacillus qingshengii]|uniref:class I SAM-dependent methyltransferase n=1 Tax=Saccharibacillus qingshengii TaxID=1763540 RepID=UPI001554334E|nr:class I SAM-dependent methyltransferase [Saccharibacillus qingshengii]
MGKTERDTQYWNKAYADPSFRADHDGWLKRYEPLLDPARGQVVDLGCGLGHNARVLHAAGFDVRACDLSERALERLRQEEPGIGTLRLDMAEELPFETGTLQAVVADLSLHYFTDSTTRRIIGELHRSLRPGGLLLCRVNAMGEREGNRDRESADDPYLYESEGIRRRFFDEKEIIKYFSEEEWETLERCERTSGRYGKEKRLWEIGLKKK